MNRLNYKAQKIKCCVSMYQRNLEHLQLFYISQVSLRAEEISRTKSHKRTKSMKMCNSKSAFHNNGALKMHKVKPAEIRK